MRCEIVAMICLCISVARILEAKAGKPRGNTDEQTNIRKIPVMKGFISSGIWRTQAT